MVEIDDIVKIVTLVLGIGAIIFGILSISTAISMKENLADFTFLGILTTIWLVTKH